MKPYRNSPYDGAAEPGLPPQERPAAGHEVIGHGHADRDEEMESQAERRRAHATVERRLPSTPAATD
jgi:hypothetical protein